MSFDEIDWDVGVLRVLVSNMLRHLQMGPADLLLSWLKGRARTNALATRADSTAAYGVQRVPCPGGFRNLVTFDSCDRSGRRGLTRKAFIARMHESFFSLDKVHPDLWENEIRHVVDRAFTVVLGLLKGENFFIELGVSHFERWLKAPRGQRAPYSEEELRKLIPLKKSSQRRELRVHRALEGRIARRLSSQSALDLRAFGSALSSPQASSLEDAPLTGPLTVVIVRPASAPATKKGKSAPPPLRIPDAHSHVLPPARPPPVDRSARMRARQSRKPDAKSV